ncbi:MAG: glycosyltransferase [Candidatus Omnitrophica bacterium]|nr:glycosyltransferase [Candidatus Omnitrophota bacterium]
MVGGGSPKVAVLMPVYYGEKPEFLSRSIESILTQTYQNLDLHLYQDGPFGEELAGMVKSYSDRYSNLIVYQNPLRRGSAICMNDMLEELLSRYLYFARMDSDDISHPERIAKQVAFLESHTGVDVVGGSIVDVDEKGKELKQVRYPLTHEKITRFFRKRNPMAHVTVMFRRSYFEKAGFYPPVRLEDGLLWMQGILSGCRFQNIPDFLVSVRRTDDLLKRRSGLKRNWQEFQVKLTINRKLRYGLSSYFYALAMFGLQILPVPIKRILYKRLR